MSSLRGLSHNCRKWHQPSQAPGSWWRETTGDENKNSILTPTIPPTSLVQHIPTLRNHCKLGENKRTPVCICCKKKLDKIQNVKQQTDPSVRPHSAHLLESPRQQHTAALAESLISIFYGDTQSQALEYLPCQITNYHINYSVTQGGGRNHLVPC